MQEVRTAQQSIFQLRTDHEIGRELRRISDWLDNHPGLLDLVATDVRRVTGNAQGRSGLTIDAILRCAILKQYRQADYRTLAFFLKDSLSFREFARCDERAPSKSTLQRLTSAIQPQTWAALNRSLLSAALELGIEDGQCVRIDATVTDSAILEPTDSGLLFDAVRVMVRLLRAARDIDPEIRFHTHLRKAKRRRLAIMNARTNDRRRPLYVSLLDTTQDTLAYLEAAYKRLAKQRHARRWLADVDHYRALIERVITQTQRRVVDGEQVPAEEKIVSLFEPHTDIIVKGSRAVQYGHKLTLSSGTSGLVLDATIESGNPADSTCFLPMLERHAKQYGEVPRQLAADGGYASRDNLTAARALGVEAVAFHKRVGLRVEDMTGDRWLYRKLCRFRAGIEAVISYLKRCFGLARCNWKGLDHFKAYVHSAVFTHNLVVLTQFQTASG